MTRAIHLVILCDMVRNYWYLDSTVRFLNHGSFGACPRVVLDKQRLLRERLERQPVQFFVRDLEGMLDEARAELAAFVGSSEDQLVWVPNATTGINTVLRSLRFEPGDELLTTDHLYNACRNALDFVAARSGARVVVAPIPFPIDSPDQGIEGVLERVSAHTRLALLDHVTSPTGLVLPIEELIRALERRGVDVLVDGAHAPGMLDLDVGALGASYYTANCHKWICAPKGAAFLHVRRDHIEEIRPVVISHGANSPRRDRSRYHLEFDWTGTADPTAALCVPEALRFVDGLMPDGWSAVRERNRRLALYGRDKICRALGISPPAPDVMIGSLAAAPLPPGAPSEPDSSLYGDPLQSRLLEEWSIEVPIVPWPAPPHRLIRISAHVYNEPSEYDHLAEALSTLFC